MVDLSIRLGTKIEEIKLEDIGNCKEQFFKAFCFSTLAGLVVQASLRFAWPEPPVVVGQPSAWLWGISLYSALHSYSRKKDRENRIWGTGKKPQEGTWPSVQRRCTGRQLLRVKVHYVQNLEEHAVRCSAGVLYYLCIDEVIAQGQKDEQQVLLVVVLYCNSDIQTCLCKTSCPPLTLSLLSSKSVFSQPFKKRLYEWCSENL